MKDDPTPEQIAREVMAEMLGMDAGEVDAESRGAQLIREGIRRYAALQTPDTQGEVSQGDEARSLEAMIAEHLRRFGYWQFEFLLGGDGGYEATYRTREGYKALSSTNQREEERGWQPIETAPEPFKDDPILVYEPGEGVRIAVAMYHFTTEPYEIFYEDGAERMLCPTHWMPLPSPPVGDEGDG